MQLYEVDLDINDELVTINYYKYWNEETNSYDIDIDRWSSDEQDVDILYEALDAHLTEELEYYDELYSEDD